MSEQGEAPTDLAPLFAALDLPNSPDGVRAKDNVLLLQEPAPSRDDLEAITAVREESS